MSTRPPIGCSVPNMVQRYLGTEYDTVKLIADNIETLLKLAKYIKGISFKLASRIVADGSDYVFDIGEVDYFDEETLFVFTDTGWQRPITDFTIGAAGTANQGKLVMKAVPPAGTVIDVVRLVGSEVITDAGKITFAGTVPVAETTLTPWFVNLKTGKTYMRVVGENATYWVEQNSHGQL